MYIHIYIYLYIFIYIYTNICMIHTLACAHVYDIDMRVYITYTYISFQSYYKSTSFGHYILYTCDYLMI
jgi:hypothetical protein